MISPAEVAKLAHRLAVSDRVIEKDYVLSWLLIAIAENDLRNGLAFKGGTALKRIYYPDYRFSEDLDFTLCAGLSHGELVSAFEDLFAWLGQQVNLTFSLRSAERNTFESSNLLVNYVGPLKAQLGSRHLKVDITRGERLQYPLVERELQAPYTDYPRGITLPTYPLEEILIEKLCALIGRTEPRDLYDVYSLFKQDDADLSFVPANFAAKCRHKGQDPAQLAQVLTGKARIFDRLWTSRLAMQVTDLPELNEVLRLVRQHLRGLGLV